MMTAFEQLSAAMARIHAIVQRGYGNEAEKARRIPEHAAGEFAHLTIKPAYRDGFSDGAERLVGELKAQMAAEAKVRGEERRDAKLRELAAELETLRNALPGLAARVTIDIGIVARALASEAKGAN